MNFGIIAAGEGSRLQQEGVAFPKPLVSLCGRPMIGRLIDIFLDNGAKKICVIVNEEMKEVAEFIRSLQQELPISLELVIKSTPSSMHSFYEIGKLLKGHGKFIVTTVDTIFREADFSKYVEAYEKAEDIDGMMAVTGYIDDEKPLYVETDSDNQIEAFLDKPSETSKYVSAGIYGLADKAVEVLDECLVAGVSRMRNYQRALITAGLKLEAYDMGKVIDVDHAGDIVKAESFLGDRFEVAE